MYVQMEWIHVLLHHHFESFKLKLQIMAREPPNLLHECEVTKSQSEPK